MYPNLAAGENFYIGGKLHLLLFSDQTLLQQNTVFLLQYEITPENMVDIHMIEIQFVNLVFPHTSTSYLKMQKEGKPLLRQMLTQVMTKERTLAS